MAAHRIAADDSGMTIVEVVIAIAIFAIGMLAVGAMHNTSLRSASTTRENTEASAWTAYHLEQLLQQDYMAADDLKDTDDDGVAGLDDDTSATADHTVTEGQYTLYWNVAEDFPVDNTKTVNVVVTWTDGATQKTFAMQGIKAR